MSTTGNRVLPLVPLILALGCGGGLRNELSMVPGTCLFHLRLEEGISPAVMEELLSLHENLALAGELLDRGPAGITLMGVDITTLSPQFLFLTRNVSEAEAAEMVSRILGLTPRDPGSRTDLADRGGMIRASVAGKKGWTAIYIGPAANVTIDAWLRMDPSGSLAADRALVEALPDNHHVTLLFPGNLFAFVSLLPVERYVPWWGDYTGAARVIRPSALVLSLSWPPRGDISFEASLAREDGGLTRARLTVSDTGISPDSAFILLSDLAGSLL